MTFTPPGAPPRERALPADRAPGENLTVHVTAKADYAVLTVDVAGTFALDEVSAALDLSRAGHTHGKLVIVP